MPFDLNIEEGESLIANLALAVPGDAATFRIAVTNRAVFLPRKKIFAVKDPTYSERVPLNRIIDVRIKKLNPLLFWTLALLMVVGGTAATTLMLLPVVRGERGELSGYPPAIALVGLRVPFLARRRYGLSISIVDKPFLWKPSLFVDRASRNGVDTFLTQAAEAFRQAGVHVQDERTGALPAPKSQGRVCPYPTARLANSSDTGGVIRACCRCMKPIMISRWEDWNGFLVRCPHCGGIHGKSWSAHHILLASVFLNAVSFFFTLRWRRALPLSLGFALFAALAIRMLDRGQLSQTLDLVLMATCFLGPVGVNSFLVLKHQMALKSASVIKS